MKPCPRCHKENVNVHTCNPCSAYKIGFQNAKDIINSEESKADLIKMQMEMYSMGRIDALKNLIKCLEEMSDDFFTKETVIQALKSALFLNEAGVR